MKKDELLKYIRANPKASQVKVIKAGFSGILKSQFGYNINRARKAAGVPIINRRKSEYKRKLSENDEKTLVFLHNCKINIDKLAEEFNVYKGTIRNTIRRERENGTKIIYDQKEKLDFAINTYNSYKKQTPLKNEDKRVRKLIEDQVIFPLIRNNVLIAVENIIKQMLPYERLINKISGKNQKNKKIYNTSKVLSKLESVLKKDHPNFHFDRKSKRILDQTMRLTVKRTFVKNGQHHIVPLSDAQKKKLNEIIEGVLKPREEKTIYLRYGLEDSQCRSLEHVGSMLNISKERTRQIEKTAIKKLRSAPKSQALISLLESGRNKILEEKIKKIADSYTIL